ncbi:MAG TPA: hypothetical protein PK605_15445 [Ignavibacteria bacterium]|nr:hypothetical protein [Bacteroidota bacterium]HRE11283.1 hypothetical protein [Ignavibacteria bacterium]HRF67261.1 hypothetical protein [Ignavibacteria bacterium]HRJ05798.1 hypothetical protein [Ignavibacteria bacterium]HRJ86768.1 hypothetical protein [Ignavibacteria bacterium]
MLQTVQKNIFIYKFLSGLSPVGFSKYTICYVSFKPKLENSYFGVLEGSDFREKLEGKIVIKAWKELPERYPVCILGDYSITPDTFSGIVMIDNSQALDNPRKYIPKILGAFKNRSTLLLNQFHGTHGRIFWKNSYDEITIDSVESFNRALHLLKKEN